MENQNERLEKVIGFLIYKGLVSSKSTQKNLAEKINMDYSNISKALKGEGVHPKTFISKINKSFGNIINEDWIFSGKGDMLKDQSNVKFSGSYISENLIDVTHVTLKTYASFIESLYNCEPDLDTYKVMPEPGEDLNSEDYMVFDIEGDSMYPTIQSESKILCKKIDENQWEYARGVVVIVYGKTLTVKRILKNDLYINNNLTLKADNPTYGELNVERHEIRGIWQAVRVVSMKIA